jgi:GTPase-activating protein BEM2
MPTLASSRPSKQRSQLNNIDLVRLHNMYEWAVKVLSDNNSNVGVSQLIKEEAFRENTHITPGSTPRKYPKVFSKIVLLQQEKNKRDRQIRERLVREKRLEQLKREKQNVPYEKAMDASKKGKQGKRTSLNPFMRVVRPLSTAFPFGGVPPPGQEGAESKKWTLEELDFTPTSKPSISIDLASARVEERKNNVRPFIFTLETEDGVKYYFQAISQREMVKWVTQVAQTGKSTSEKRRTYVGVPTGFNDFYGAPKNLGRHPTAGKFD